MAAYVKPEVSSSDDVPLSAAVAARLDAADEHLARMPLAPEPPEDEFPECTCPDDPDCQWGDPTIVAAYMESEADKARQLAEKEDERTDAHDAEQRRVGYAAGLAVGRDSALTEATSLIGAELIPASDLYRHGLRRALAVLRGMSE